jgi:putative DNA methylase
MAYPVKSPKKLIEVALPLDAINAAAAREKSIRHGHPSTLHLWWARRPLAAARAVIFGQMVNDPSWKWEMEHPGEIPRNNQKATWAASRRRLFGIIEDLVKWESTTDEVVLEKARAEIWKSWRETCGINQDHPQATELFNANRLPSFHDPFAGGGAIPLEAQRLGLEAFASDLNPIAVLICKAMIEIPSKFAGMPPVSPCSNDRETLIERKWHNVQGLAEDVRHYGQWIRDEAERRIGGLYPSIEITHEMAKLRPDLKPVLGQKLTVIAYLWTRTVKSPNPAFKHVDVPLASTFMLSTKEGKEVYVEPKIENGNYHFVVKIGRPRDVDAAKNGTKLARGANFQCLMSGTPIEGDYIKAEGRAGRIRTRMMAVVAASERGRIYLSPTPLMEELALKAKPAWVPQGSMVEDARAFTPYLYGLGDWSDLFTQRQLVALTTFSELVNEVREKVKQAAFARGYNRDPLGIAAGGTGANAYAEAVSTYLAFAVSKIANIGSSIASWMSDRGAFRETFARQAIQMTWDFAEANPFADLGGSFGTAIEKGAMAIEMFPVLPPGIAQQSDAATQLISSGKVVSTDPPYYDNVPYADLSDFFYGWLRNSLRSVFPDLFATIAVPKAEELVATSYRHDGKENAEKFFLNGMTEAMHRIAARANAAFPITIYYAFKQSETRNESGTASTGWETFLEAVIRAGFAITGTWPMRTEGEGRLRATGSNALASSIVLVCRSRDSNVSSISRRDFLRQLNITLPVALDEMTKGTGQDRSPVAPVDLSQAILGPGMAVFSKYPAVLEADGSPMSVRTALTLINRFLAEDDFDHDTQFCLHWFEQHGWNEGRFGEADTLARAKGTSVDGVKRAGILFAAASIVRLLKWTEYPSDWNPEEDSRLPVWEALHQLIRSFKTEGESGAGVLLAAVKAKAEPTRQLAYRLYTLCERAGWAEDARSYNEIVTSWGAIEAAASQVPGMKQADLFEG